MLKPQQLFLTRIANISVDEELEAGIPLAQDFRLTSGVAFVDRLNLEMSASLLHWFGMHEQLMLRRPCLVAYSFDDRLNELKNGDPTDHVSSFLMFVDCLLTCLWLIKDHAAHIMRGAVVFADKEKPCFPVQLVITTVKSDGSNEHTRFQRVELETALRFCRKIWQSRSGAAMLQPHASEPTHPGQPRITRALRLVSTARNTRSLTIKIANCCAALEALLRGDSGTKQKERTKKGVRKEGIAKEIARRLKVLLSDSPEPNERFPSLVKDIYSVRSCLFHGQVMGKPLLERLPSTACAADNLVRSLIRRLHEDDQLGPQMTRSLDKSEDRELQSQLDATCSLG